MIGYTCAYLRYYYPTEFVTSYLQNAKDKPDIVSGTMLAKQLGIKISSIKFRYSSDRYTCDADARVIYKPISSLSGFGVDLAIALDKLKDNKYNSFVDFLVDNPCGKSTEPLIKLDFFSEFGRSAYLLKVCELFNTYYGKKQIKKESCDAYESILQKYCSKETDKMYKFDDGVGADILIEMTADIPNESISVSELISTQKEYLGYIEYVNPKLPESWWYVTELKIYKNKLKPYVTLYNLRTGETLKTKITNSDEYASNPFDSGSILNVWLGEKAKCKLIDGKWQKTNEKETVMNHWEIVK